MKVIEQTVTKLRLGEKPIFTWMLGSILILGGILALTTGKSSISFTCSRETNCQITASGLLGKEVREIPIKELQEAQLRKSSSRGYNRISILTTKGSVTLITEDPFGISIYTYYKYKQTVSLINNFIAQPGQKSLAVYHNNIFNVLIPTFILTGIGVFIILCFASITDCEFDKDLNTLTLTNRGVLGKKTIQRQIQEITDIVLEESKSSKGSIYDVKVVLVSGENLPLTSAYTSDEKKVKKNLSKQIRKFLD